MCAGAIYWANIGRVVYGMTERRLLQLTGSNEQNPTFDLPCREALCARPAQHRGHRPHPRGGGRGRRRPRGLLELSAQA